MRVYVAGKDVARAQAMMDRVTEAGYRVAFDWIKNMAPEPFDPELARREVLAISYADAMIYLWEEDQESARYEAGMAMMRGIPLIVVGHRSFFFDLPAVTVVDTDEDAIEALHAAV